MLSDCTKSQFVALEWNSFRKWKAILMHTGIIIYLNMIYINDTTFLMDYFFERLDFFKREDSSSLLLLWNHHNIYCPQLWVAWKHFFVKLMDNSFRQTDARVMLEQQPENIWVNSNNAYNVLKISLNCSRNWASRKQACKNKHIYVFCI